MLTQLAHSYYGGGRELRAKGMHLGSSEGCSLEHGWLPTDGCPRMATRGGLPAEGYPRMATRGGLPAEDYPRRATLTDMDTPSAFFFNLERKSVQQ